MFEPRIFFDFFSGTQLQSSRLAEWVSECVRECAAWIPQHTHYYKYISNDGNQADYRIDRQSEIERQFRIKKKNKKHSLDYPIIPELQLQQQQQ